jgi:heme A synthase
MEGMMPLSEHEQRLFHEIEQALYAEDPKFASSVRSGRPRNRVRLMLVLSVLGVLVGLAVVLIGLTANVILVGVLGFVLIVSSCVVAASALRGPRQNSAASLSANQASANRSGSLRTKMEDRMRRRFEES